MIFYEDEKLAAERWRKQAPTLLLDQQLELEASSVAWIRRTKVAPKTMIGIRGWTSGIEEKASGCIAGVDVMIELTELDAFVRTVFSLDFLVLLREGKKPMLKIDPYFSLREAYSLNKYRSENKYREALDVNQNGTVIVGNSGQIDPEVRAIRWKEGSIHRIELLRDGTFNSAEAVSDDGIIVVGCGDTTGGVRRAYRWKEGAFPEMEDLGVPGGYSESGATGVNRDGSIVVGWTAQGGPGTSSWAARWKEIGSGFEIKKLGTSTSWTGCFSHDTNDNGTVIVGYYLESSDTHAVCWLEGETTEEIRSLSSLQPSTHSVALAVNADGTIIVGSSNVSENPLRNHAVRWKRNPNTGIFDIEDLGVLPVHPEASSSCVAYGTNDTGTVIVGINFSSGTSFSRQAFIWREDAEPRMQALHDIEAGYEYSSAYGVSRYSTTAWSAVVGNSAFSEADQGSSAVRWLNLSVNDLHFPPYS